MSTYESAAAIYEELRQLARTMPRVMVWTATQRPRPKRPPVDLMVSLQCCRDADNCVSLTVVKARDTTLTYALDPHVVARLTS